MSHKDNRIHMLVVGYMINIESSEVLSDMD